MAPDAESASRYTINEGTDDETHTDISLMKPRKYKFVFICGVPFRFK